MCTHFLYKEKIQIRLKIWYIRFLKKSAKVLQFSRLLKFANPNFTLHSRKLLIKSTIA